jgi:hypothetical protein
MIVVDGDDGGSGDDNYGGVDSMGRVNLIKIFRQKISPTKQSASLFGILYRR